MCLKEMNKNTSLVSVDDNPFSVRSQQTTFQPGECGDIEILYKPLRSISILFYFFLNYTSVPLTSYIGPVGVELVDFE